MNRLIVNGKMPLGGKIKVHGAKNSALPILAATVLVSGECIIHNCPCLSDIDVTIDILRRLGAKVSRDGSTVTVVAKDISMSSIPEDLMREMRSSIIFLGSLLSRTGSVSLSSPGGCDIGVRPVDLHLSSLKKLGADVTENGCTITCTTPNGIIGAEVILPFPSVGATENIIIASSVSKGRTVIINAAREPEIIDLANFLNKCGARINGAGEGTVVIDGVKCLHACEHSIIPDRIVASTYMSVSAVTGEELVITDVCPSDLAPVFPVYMEMGCKLFLDSDSVRIKPPRRLKCVKTIKTMPYPGFPTDSQPLTAAALVKAKGTSVIMENIFENRFRYMAQLSRFGADVSLSDKAAVINGVDSLYSASVKCTDLRGGAALVVAALAAQGVSYISDVSHIDRGYENIETALKSIGADIKRECNEKK